MRNTEFPKHTLIASLVAALVSQYALAAELPLAQYPAGSAYKMPIPNVILSVDDSGSMNWADDGGSTTSTKPARITSLKNGLKNVLVTSSKYDGQFRLAWQSMWRCNNIPSSQAGCDGKNTMGVFSGQHKLDFETWRNSITAGDGTPSHTMMWNAGQYMKTTGPNNPWNAVPGTSDSQPVACRRAYHIFMTDGGWNTYLPDTNFNAFDFQTKMISSHAEAIGNADGTDRRLPDNTQYSTATSNTQTMIYRDSWGGGTKDGAYVCTEKDRRDRCIAGYIPKYSYPTLSDMAFHYWATNLQPGIQGSTPGSIPFEPKKSTDETFTNPLTGRTVTITPYWNPKNDPATWPHLVTHTIGYGSRASNWDDTTINPIFTNGMYGDGFIQAILGLKTWTDATSLSFDGSYTSGPRNKTAKTDYARPEELWHMAINSRGKFFPVATGPDLEKAFDEIFSSIVADNTSPLTSFTSASGSISRNDTEMFQSGYVAAEDLNSTQNKWSGFVSSEKILTITDPDNPNKKDWKTEPNPSWGLNSNKIAPNNHSTTADKLDALSDISARLILSFNEVTQKGISFEWGSTPAATPLSLAQQSLLKNGGTNEQGMDRLNFIRGDQSKEENHAGGTFRKRKSRQGDIVNSAVWYAGAPLSGYKFDSYRSFSNTNKSRIPMIYVGGNDGMLHGFSAKDGTEKLAYVPQGVIKNLYRLTEPAYDHRYYVDGSPFTGDLNPDPPASGGANWKTYLVGTLGAGGKGYFVLDVTKPGTSDNSIATDFTKANAASLVVMDKTDGSDSDIGYLFGNPVVDEANQQRALQITPTNDGRWALITGNGYNSVNERPVLLIQYLDGSKELKKIEAVPVTNPKHAEANQNGLSTPQFMDINADGIPDAVYAGDLRGNLWKFDIASKDASLWNVAFEGKPLFTATYSTSSGGGSTSSRQPITTPPVLRPNRQIGGLMVAFGTGRNLTAGDRTDTDSKQTVYSILDNTRYSISSAADSKGKVVFKTSSPTPAVVADRSVLMNQAVVSGSKKNGAGKSAGREFSTLGSASATYDCTGITTACTVQKGWFFDLPEAGERVLNGIDFFDGGNILEIMSEAPASGGVTSGAEERCEPSPKSAKPFRTLINIERGSRPKTQVMDQNGDGVYNSEDGFANRSTAATKELRFSTKQLQVRKGSDGKTDYLAKSPELLLRPSWRQLK